MYCASKAAVDNMTKSLARALAPRIRVVSISPGLVETDFIKSMDQRWRDEQLGTYAAEETHLSQRGCRRCGRGGQESDVHHGFHHRHRRWPAAELNL